jgi:hypothetical protein
MYGAKSVIVGGAAEMACKNQVLILFPKDSAPTRVPAMIHIPHRVELTGNPNVTIGINFLSKDRYRNYLIRPPARKTRTQRREKGNTCKNGFPRDGRG